MLRWRKSLNSKLHHSGLCLALLLTVSCSDARLVEKEDWEMERDRMVQLIRLRGVRDERVLDAMSAVRRHKYIPEQFRAMTRPYGDHPSPIGEGQTISQPYIVAYMTEALEVEPGDKVLEIGTGSGYQAAILAEMGSEVYTIEIIPALGEHAKTVLAEEGYDEVKVLVGDGYKGWPEHAPFDAIIVTCAPDAVPQPLIEQLREGGKMIIPVGKFVQNLILFEKTDEELRRISELPVRFVPMLREQ